MPTYCQFNDCDSNIQTYGGKEKHFYRFPKDEERCKVWVEESKNPRLQGLSPEYLYRNCRVCEDHFLDWCFLNKDEKVRLVHNAIPNQPKTLPQPKSLPCEDVQSSISVSTEISASEDDVKPPTRLLKNTNHTICDRNLVKARPPEVSLMHNYSIPHNVDANTLAIQLSLKNYMLRYKTLAEKLKKKNQEVRRLRKKTEKLQESLKHFKSFKSEDLKNRFITEGISERLAKFLVRQIKLNLSSKGNKRYTAEEKNLAYSILCTSKGAYNILRKLIELPSETTLRSYFSAKTVKCDTEQNLQAPQPGNDV